MDLQPDPKPFTSLGFEPSAAAIECPWGPVGMEGGGADVYYGWAAFEPGDRERYLSTVQGWGYSTRPVEGGLVLVEPEGDVQGGGDPIEFLVTDDWVAFGPVGAVDDIVWTR